MKILCADYILTCDEDFTIVKDGAVCFDDKIIKIGKAEQIIENFPYAKVKELSVNSVIMPSLVNTHVHLEFSANKTSLEYGDFTKWLQSMIQNRDRLIKECDTICYEEAIDQMLSSGVLIFGAISSFGKDMSACFQTPQRVVYFNEILGSNPDMIDDIKIQFNKRVAKSFEYASDIFIPAVSVHSIYSTHPELSRYVLEFAKRKDLVVSTHFMESLAEREWIDRGEGDFKKLLSIFNKNAKPMYDPLEFLDMFKDCKSIFAHCNVANDEELDKIAKIGSISHCNVSNRVLNNPLLDIKKIFKKGINFTVGTDGLSSNISLNMWDELRSILFSQSSLDIVELSKLLLIAATRYGAMALGLEDSCCLKKDKNADLITITLPDKINNIQNLPLNLILHTKEIRSGYIGGERYV